MHGQGTGRRPQHKQQLDGLPDKQDGRELPRRRNREGIPYPRTLKHGRHTSESANTAQTRKAPFPANRIDERSRAKTIPRQHRETRTLLRTPWSSQPNGGTHTHVHRPNPFPVNPLAKPLSHPKTPGKNAKNAAPTPRSAGPAPASTTCFPDASG